MKSILTPLRPDSGSEGGKITSMRYVFIGVGLAAVIASLAVWHHQHHWTLLLGGAAFLAEGLAHREHNPNWTRPTSLRG